MQLTMRSLNIVNRYLSGDDNALNFDDDKSIAEFDSQFFNTPLRCKDDHVLSEEMDLLLTRLHIPVEERTKYLKSKYTVHGLLKLLAEQSKETNPEAHLQLNKVIKEIDNFQLIRSLKFFTTQLQPDSNKKDLLAFMKSYDKKMAKVNSDFYQTTIGSDPVILTVAKDILRALNVPERQWGRYTGTLTVHDFLKELTEHIKETDKNKNQLAQLKTFVKTIETKSKISRQKALLYGLGGLLPVVASMPYGGFSVIQEIVTAALFMPIVGMVGAVGLGLYGFYQTTFDKNLPLLDKIRDNFFILASTALKVTAYSLVIATAATAAPVAAILTAVASGIGVIHEGFKLLQMKLAGKAQKPLKDDASLESKQERVRFDAEYSAKKKSLWVNIGAGLVLTSLAVASCIFPVAGIVVGGVMGATLLTQYAAEKLITSSTKRDLHVKFTALELADERKTNDVTLENSTTLLHERLQISLTPAPLLANASALASGENDEEAIQLITRSPNLVEDDFDEMAASGGNSPTSGYYTESSEGSAPDSPEYDEGYVYIRREHLHNTFFNKKEVKDETREPNVERQLSNNN